LIKIIVASKHLLTRQGLKSLFREQSEFRLVGEAADGMETIHLVERMQPDVLVLDLAINGIDGFEVMRKLHKRVPQTGIVVLTDYINNVFLTEALIAGARAHVNKGAGFDELALAIKKVAQGQYLITGLSEDERLKAIIRRVRKKTDPLGTLTIRECDVLRLVARGETSASIAGLLDISRRTVEVHRARVMRKLRLDGEVDLVCYARKLGIIG
jgi:DNA-binding NarL/FixJ family response regulator